MRAIRVARPREVAVVDVPVPDAAAGEVLVDVACASVCATDRKLALRGSEPPRVPGHEVAGVLPDGTRVGVHPDIGCGRCAACRAGFENRCPERTAIGLDRDGGLADRVAVPERHVVPLDGVPLELSPILEPLGCCLHAVSLLAVDRGDFAVVVGAGSMGILSMWALQHAGATVAVCQRSPERRELAAELGADAVLRPDESAAPVLGAEPRVAVVTAPGSQPLQWALNEVAVGGSVHVFAGTPGGAEIDANVVHYRHLTLVGSTGSTLRDYERARSLVAEAAIPLERLPRTRVSLEEVPRVPLERASPTDLKVVVDVEGGRDE